MSGWCDGWGGTCRGWWWCSANPPKLGRSRTRCAARSAACSPDLRCTKARMPLQKRPTTTSTPAALR
eukprot:3399618-Pleurochrysis_carterae.AAC.1